MNRGYIGSTRHWVGWVEDEQKSKKENMQIVNANIENKSIELLQSLLECLKIVSEPEEKYDVLKKLNEIVSWNCGLPKQLISIVIIQMAELLLDKNEKVRMTALSIIDSLVNAWRDDE